MVEYNMFLCKIPFSVLGQLWKKGPRAAHLVFQDPLNCPHAFHYVSFTKNSSHSFS